MDRKKVEELGMEIVDLAMEKGATFEELAKAMETVCEALLVYSLGKAVVDHGRTKVFEELLKEAEEVINEHQ